MTAYLRTLFAIVLVIILVIIFHYLTWLKPIENFFRQVINPGGRILYNLSINLDQGEDNFSSVDDLKSAYKKLKEDILKNAIDQTKLVLLEKENSELRSQLNFFQKKTLLHVGAEVIGKNIEPLASTIIINRGQNDGLKIGQPAIIGEGILIGVIVKVDNDTAIIRLIDDNQSKIAATSLNKDNSIGIVEGGYGISIKMVFIPQNEQLNVEDIVVTSGLQENIPAGLAIGTIEAVEKEAYQPFQQAIITPYAQLDKIKQVSVIYEKIEL